MDLEDLMDLADESRVAELENLISEARHSYYVKHAPTVFDDVYDAWIDELRDLKASSPQVTSVGAPPVSEWKKSRHEIPMGSLEKVNTMGELTAWVTKLLGSPSFEELLVTEKLDGISIALRYESGAFSKAVTRGDGIEGEDISINVAKMMGVPALLPVPFTGQLRGEVVCTLSRLVKHFPDYSNPRNTAGGVASRLDGIGCEHLTVMLYQVPEGRDDLKKRSDHMALLDQLGFTTPNWYITGMTPGVKTPHDIWVDYQQTTRSSLDYAIDGLVVELNDIEKQLVLGDDNGRPRGARAFKFAPVSRETVLRAIENSTAGTGRITPVAIFDEVNLLGTRVTRASLYNWKNIRDLKLDVGARILVARANDVIPRVTELIVGTGTIAISPAACPSCSCSTEWDGEYLVCPNASECPAQALGRLSRYVKALNILEWGEAVLERLVASGLVSTVSDLYRLRQEDLEGIERMGEKSARKLLNNLHAKSPIPIESFFGALSIPGCGESIISLVVDAGYDTFDQFAEVTYDQLMAVPGLGPVRSATMRGWLDRNVSWLRSSGIPTKDRARGQLSGKSFCFTGKTATKRADLEDMARARGGIVKGSVGKGLTYLVMADPSSGSTKSQAALKLGTQTLSEEEFLRMAGP